jgi:type IV secretory pathway VirB10-like protein
MISRSLAFGVLAAGCITAAAGGSYLAVRQNATAAEPVQPVASAAPVAPAVQETEAIVKPSEPAVPVERTVERAAPAPRVVERKPAARPTRSAAAANVPRETHPRPEVAAPAEPSANAQTAPPISAPTEPLPAPVEVMPVNDPPARAPEPVYEETVLPVASVIGLELETSLSSERARVEDRVDARVTRDVYADGRLAIPAGSRVIGAVSLVERGGKVKERARLGVRFHTLVLAGGRQVDLRTEAIYREGESPANDSSKKIGGAAIGGAVLGAILGGGKGAIAGGAAGAAGGTAVVMAGDRKPATLPAGSIVTVKLSAPVTLEVER